MEIIFLEITVILCLATILAVIFRLLKQPAILAYILTGVLVGPLGFVNLANREILVLMGQFGIALLLFLVGMELKFSDLRSVGKTVLVIGTSQILFTSAASYLMLSAFGFSQILSLYLSLALTFSSTIIVVKLLSDKRDTHSLYGKISVGILLVQDLFAMAFLILLSGFSSANGQSLALSNVFILVIKGILLFGGIIFVQKFFLQKIVDLMAHSLETLFLFSLAWAFGLAALVSSPFIGFSIEIGAFLAGLSLANSTENFQIATKLKPLRDFFLTIFFVTLGMNLRFDNISSFLPLVIGFCAFVLLAKPLIVMGIMGFMGYRKRTSFLTGLSMTQISEFSLIIVFLGSKLGHLPQNIVSIITLVGIITFTFSTYMIGYGNKLYLRLSVLLSPLERKYTKKEQLFHSNKELGNFKDHAVVVGGDQMGESVLDALMDQGKEVVVIDFDPVIIQKLENKNVHRLFGDISDSEIKNLAKIHAASIIISTIPDVEDNLLLLRELKNKNSKATIILTAFDSTDAKILYAQNADYVVLPHLAGGRHLAKIIRDDSLKTIEEFKSQDLALLS